MYTNFPIVLYTPKVFGRASREGQWLSDVRPRNTGEAHPTNGGTVPAVAPDAMDPDGPLAATDAGEFVDVTCAKVSWWRCTADKVMGG